MAQVNLGHVVGPGVPTGGTAGQVLKKNGSTNYDTSWATLNSGNIPISASDNTTVQQSLAAVKSDMGIVEDGNTATHTIAAGQYVIWKGALYTASAAIPTGTTLSTSNLTAVSGGGLNALNGNIATINSNLQNYALKSDLFPVFGSTIANITTASGSWTATRNCWCAGTLKVAMGSAAIVYYDGYAIAEVNGANDTEITATFPVKQGAVITTRNVGVYNLKFY